MLEARFRPPTTPAGAHFADAVALLPDGHIYSIPTAVGQALREMFEFATKTFDPGLRLLIRCNKEIGDIITCSWYIRLSSMYTLTGNRSYEQAFNIVRIKVDPKTKGIYPGKSLSDLSSTITKNSRPYPTERFG